MLKIILIERISENRDFSWSTLHPIMLIVIIRMKIICDKVICCNMIPISSPRYNKGKLEIKLESSSIGAFLPVFVGVGID